MIGISGYGSSDESENEKLDSRQPVLSTSISSANITNPPHTTLKEDKKLPKKRKLDITFLPKEIQDALTRGVSSADSDDEDDSNLEFKKLLSSGSSSLSSKDTSNKTRSALLDQLPKPKSSSDSISSTAFIPTNIIKTVISKPINKSNQFPTKVKQSLATYEEEENEEKEDVYRNDNNEEEEEEEEEEGNNIRTQQEGGTILHSNQYKNQVDGRIDEVDKDERDTTGAFKFSSNYVHFNPHLHPQPEVSSQPFSASAVRLESYDIPTSYVQPGPYSYAYPDYDEVVIGNTAVSGKRKREREIEEQLLRGNVSVIDAIDSTKTVNSNNLWDAQTYQDQIQREQELKNVYHFGSNDNSGVVQPTKLQNRRHQINSLVVKAAETEIQMLDAKAHRMRSKSQTQGRYGW